MGAKKNADKSLAERIKELQILNLEGAVYLGQTEKTTDGLKIVNAILIGELAFEETIKKWIREDNSNTLEELEVEGANYSLLRKKFSEDQVFQIELIAMKASYQMSKVLTKLENESF